MRRSRRGPTSSYGSIPLVWSLVNGGSPWDLGVTLKRQRMATLRTLAVMLRAACGQQKCEAGGTPIVERGARQSRPAQMPAGAKKKARRPRRASCSRGGCWSDHTVTCGAHRPDDHGPLPVSLASGIAIKRWKSVLDVDALRAKATSPLAEVWLHGKFLYALMLERRMRRQLGESWGRLDRERLGTWWRVWGMRKDERGPMITGALFWRRTPGQPA